ncbi:MAG: hypothetical protein MJ177_07880, partial [Clostridia bacterium]|nr:hypothetical protein [Clostridia bacterium]
PRTQTSQAICIYYGVFNDSEIRQAGKVLVDLVHEADDHIDCGIIGLRVIFHVLSDLGEGALAYKMITRDDYPSYGMFIRRGCTSIPEDFQPDCNYDHPASLNHHFLGDYVSWFMQRVAGLRVNPKNTCPYEFEIAPDFIPALENAEAYYDSVCGRVSVRWERKDGYIALSVCCPDKAKGFIKLKPGYTFIGENKEIFPHNASMIELKAGEYKVR